MGDTDLPEAGIAAGSSHTASICNAVARACEEIRTRVATAAVTSNEGPFAGREAASLTLSGNALRGHDGTNEPLDAALARVAGSAVEVRVDNTPTGMPAEALGQIAQGQMAISRGTGRKDVTAYAFGAQFVEVRIHARKREIRVPRMVGAFAAGTIINPVAVHSQYMGGMIWGIGSALHEETEIDEQAARYMNDNIAEYLIPVNADVRSVEMILVPEEDTVVNPLGIKGIGEIGIVGVNAAIANAVFHATGRRIRKLPIHIEHLL
jgi:xanthine dehydrogenase YagR molybdenum-binding subunit